MPITTIILAADAGLEPFATLLRVPPGHSMTPDEDVIDLEPREHQVDGATKTVWSV